jgi:hypothetical protein
MIRSELLLGMGNVSWEGGTVRRGETKALELGNAVHISFLPLTGDSASPLQCYGELFRTWENFRSETGNRSIIFALTVLYSLFARRHRALYPLLS